MRIIKSTPVMFVDRIEPHLGWWRDKLGYAAVAEVPHGDALGFVILVKDGSEAMLQTWDSGMADLASVTEAARAKGVGFFHEVDDLEGLLKALPKGALLAEPRVAFYGMKEVWVKDTAGFVHGYAQKV